MDNPKKGKKRFKFIFISLIIIFGFLYFAGKTGYYESRLASRTLLTKESIMEFEKDISEGKAVDLKDYVNTEVKDYNNKYSNLGYKISSFISKGLNSGITWLVKLMKSLFI